MNPLHHDVHRILHAERLAHLERLERRAAPQAAATSLRSRRRVRRRVGGWLVAAGTRLALDAAPAEPPLRGRPGAAASSPALGGR